MRELGGWWELVLRKGLDLVSAGGRDFWEGLSFGCPCREGQQVWEETERQEALLVASVSPVK